MLVAFGLSRLKPSGRNEKGFTLVELLIVLAILAVLSAVVLYNLGGMFDRGSAEAYYTDQKTIQQLVALFLYDTHVGPGSDWGNGTAGHHYPTVDGKATAEGRLAAVGNPAVGANKLPTRRPPCLRQGLPRGACLVPCH